MNNIIKLDSVDVYNKLRGVETLHPLITVVDLSKVKAIPAVTINFGVYTIFLKDIKCGELKYGRNSYDFQEDTLVCVAPGQVVASKPDVKVLESKGWALMFHPDLIKGTTLGKTILEYTFFSYDANEALHLSGKERKMLLECFENILQEMQHSIDKHSKQLIVSNIELLLNYCKRFYDRQFITRDNDNKGNLEKFEQIINNYFLSEKPKEIGLPSVQYCADELNLSANYFGDLIKKETGVSAQEYIQTKVIDIAKERIFNIDKSISEIAYELGFKYPQHFARLFKSKTGLSPSEYRNLN